MGAEVALVSATFVTTMAYVAWHDIRTRHIRNVVTVPGTLIALAVAGLGGVDALASSAVGMAVALAVTGAVYLAARGGFGMGDVKLSGFVGAVLGASAVPAFLVLASLLGALGAAVVLARGGGRRTSLAYGPYLACSAAILCCWVGPVIATAGA